MEFTKDIELNSSPVVGQELILNYHGFLSGSTELSIVYGFGETWNYTTETPMEKTSTGFSAKINMLDFDTFNFCFRNSNNEWDNNYNCNYVSEILPCTQTAEKFDIDAFIEELLEPICSKTIENSEISTPVQISAEPIDLGLEISNILSQIKMETPVEELTEYATLDEILAGTVIEETPVELFEKNMPDELFEIEIEDAVAKLFENEPDAELIFPDVPVQEETALINIDDPFMISPRKLSRFYAFKKRIKLSFYKLLVKLPKMIFGIEEQ